jgi:hypothetical protein
MKPSRYTISVNCLTKQERWVLGIVVLLLVTGWATKMYRAAHPALKPGGGALPATVAIQQARP